MKVLGIIAEYNPFHNGHLYHLAESKKVTGADTSVVVMSGNFTQRGDAAILDKWVRAKAAVECGVDLVLELPAVYACNNAEYFAKGAIGILNGLSCVDAISFGSESGDIKKLSAVAVVVSDETDDFKRILRERLETGSSFPRARAEAVRMVAGAEAAEILAHPNNILAVEYLKQLTLTRSKITPFTVKRKGQGYNAAVPAGEFSSAAAIRGILESGGGAEEIRRYIPAECFDVIKTFNIDINEKTSKMFLLLSAKVLTENEREAEEIFSAGEGLGNKMKKTIRYSAGREDLISQVKSKRYTRTRIQRLLTHTLLDFKTDDVQNFINTDINYARILAFNGKGAALLKRIKDAGAELPVITNINKQVGSGDKIAALLRYDILASDIYNLISSNDINERSDFVVSPYHKFG